MRRILLTGVAGFIGSRTAQMLVESDFEVLGVDNFDPYYDLELKRRRINRLSKSENFRFVELNIENKAELDQLVDGISIDAIINLAARAGVRNSIRYPAEYYRTNVLGALNLLDLAVANSIPRYILASTSSVYAGHSGPFTEDLEASRPLSPYAASKRSAEILAHSYQYLYNINIVVLRYFTVYGPWGRPDMAILRFVKRISEGEPIDVFGDGKHSRDFTYIDDIARGTIAALGVDGFEVINLGNGTSPVCLNTVIELAEKYCGRKAIVRNRPPVDSDMLTTHARVEKARQILNWQSEVTIEQGVIQTVDWYKKERDWLKNLEI